MEKELIQKCLEGDEQAWEMLFFKHKNLIYYHCLEMCKDEQIAADLTQEAFVLAFQHLKDFRGNAQFSTWIWRIAHNHTLNYLKKKRPEKEFKEEISAAPVVVSNEEKKEIIKAYLPFLNPRQREVIDMYVFQGLSQKEIAFKLGLPYGTVRSRLYYARKKIRLLSKDFRSE